jgi:hypothetical protein
MMQEAPNRIAAYAAISLFQHNFLTQRISTAITFTFIGFPLHSIGAIAGQDKMEQSKSSDFSARCRACFGANVRNHPIDP